MSARFLGHLEVVKNGKIGWVAAAIWHEQKNGPENKAGLMPKRETCLKLRSVLKWLDLVDPAELKPAIPYMALNGRLELYKSF